MALKPARRIYSFSDANLTETADKVLLACGRDIADFTARFSFDAADLTAAEGLRDTFIEFPIDENFSNAVSEAVIEKNKAMKKVDQFVSDILLMADLQYPVGDSKRARFEFPGYGKRKENERLGVAETVLDNANANIGDLDERGLSALMITNFGDAISAAREKLRIKIQTVQDRDAKSRDRVLAGNTLYSKLIEICKIGRQLYENTDESKYNDYIINPSHADDTEVVTGSPAPNAIHIPTVSFSAGSNRIVFENKGGDSLIIYFAAEVDDEPGVLAQTVAAGGTWEGTAEDLGWNATSTPNFLVKNPNGVIGAFVMAVD